MSKILWGYIVGLKCGIASSCEKRDLGSMFASCIAQVAT